MGACPAVTTVRDVRAHGEARSLTTLASMLFGEWFSPVVNSGSTRRPPASRRQRRGGIALVAVTATVLVASACAVGPDTGPPIITGGGDGGGQAATSSSAPAQAPTLQAPKTDLEWTDCGATLARDYDTTAPAGVTIECAELTSPIDPDNPQSTLTVALTRARVASTPADAAPLVLTAGTDMPSSRALMLLGAGAGRSLLSTHPVVAIDRRGIPQSTALDCLTRADRDTLAAAGWSRGASQDQRITALAAAASSAADGCTETLSPDQLAFGVRSAATDLETLRQRWNVPQLGLIGLGEGADVAIAYTALYGGRTGRIILDTPTPYGANARDAAAGEANGVQAALTTFAQRCAALGSACPLGSGAAATLGDVIDKARSGSLGGLSDAQVLAAVTTALAVAPSTSQGLTSVAATIAAADNGNTASLSALATQAATLRLSDGQIVSSCNDVTGPVSQNEVGGLATTWAKQNPLTGAVTALALMRCNGWASSPAVTPPSSFPVSPLVLDNSGDPINGNAGTSALDTLFARASTVPVTVSWDGLGYSALARSSCVADVVAQYVATTPLDGPQDRGCPT